MSEHTWRELERADMDTAAANRFDGERRAAMSELLPCPFCGGEAEIRGDSVLFVQCAKCGTRYGDRYYATKAEAIAAWNTRAVSGDTSDGYHTFDELYYHRTALFACLVSMQPRQMAFKSWKHSDGTMYEGMFITGIYTSRGWCTYHCEAEWWPLFDCSEREFAPKWDGHTPSDAIHRLMGDFLPEQEVCGEVSE